MANKKKINMNKDYFRERCTEVNILTDDAKERARISKVIEDLRDTLRAHKDLVALSAPQLAHRDRIFCMKFAGNDIRTFINPLVIQRKELTLNAERQIGFGEYHNPVYFVPRHKEITAGYQTPTGRVESNTFTNEASMVFDQMIQLLDGIFISDYGLEKLDGFDELPEEDKKEIFKLYAEALEAQEKDLSNDEYIKSLDKLTKFYTECTLGHVEVLPMTEEEKAHLVPVEETEKKEESANA